MAQTQTFEEWYDGLGLLDMIDYFMDPTRTIMKAYLDGIRQSESTLIQTLLDEIDGDPEVRREIARHDELEAQPWFEGASNLIDADDWEGAANLMKEHGLTACPFCDGESPYCGLNEFFD